MLYHSVHSLCILICYTIYPWSFNLHHLIPNHVPKLFDFYFVSIQKNMLLVMIRQNLFAHLNIQTCYYWCWWRSICETFISDDMSHPVNIQNCFKVCFYLQCMQGHRSRGGQVRPTFQQ